MTITSTIHLNNNMKESPMAEYTPTDSLRYLAARCTEILGGIDTMLVNTFERGLSEEESEHISDETFRIREELREHLDAHTDERHSYDDGRPVQSAVMIEGYYTCPQVWHPDRAHGRNQPHVVIPDLESRFSGARYSVMVTGDEVERLAVYERI